MMQLSSTKKRKRLRRHDASSTNKTIRTECGVCMEILRLLTSGWIGDEWRSGLGNFKEVMISTKCDIHPRMFRSYFNIDFENAHIFGFMASGSGDNGGILLMASGADSHESFCAWSLHLVSDTIPRGPSCRGKIVNQRWIEKNIIRRWKRDCDGRNNKDCQMCPAASRLISARPSWLIDTWRLCLTPGAVNAPYVALSYVWGKVPFFKTTRKDLPRLQLDQAFFDSRKRLGIPRVIEDAIKLLGLLEERYLWVDAICIVQDDDEARHDQIKNMASIFANATVTIVSQGADANYGLRGLRDISEPRNFVQDVFTLEKGSRVISTQEQNKDQNPWSQRGWTFQEEIFARRQLVFSADRVQWKCACGSFLENLTPLPASEIPSQCTQSKKSVFSTSLPDFDGYAELVFQYNNRQFTFPEDALDAFSGITSTLSHKFYGGFICGLPALFFDMALIWQPWDTCERRIPSKPSNPTEMGLPSWSWVGWKGETDHWNRNYNIEYIRSNRYKGLGMPRTIPLVQWYSRSWSSMDLAAIKEPLELQELKKQGLEGVGSLPPGWKRFDYHGVAYEPDIPQTRYVYKHECDPTTEFWYPIPLCESQHSLPRPRGTDTLLCCRTQKTRAFLSHGLSSSTRPHCISIRNSQGTWIGELRLHDNKISTKNPSQRPPSSEIGDLCELVAISRGYFYEKWAFSMYTIDEWSHKERPKSAGKYEYYNVLWVEGRDGIAYRKACGRVMKSAWECQELEWVDLVLG
ncbi:HET-domain-containing protein [Stipitochalara longipes BDJ]|nr:HET-domain-containing protein [Stipitochalara longipes BDJ]